MRLALACLLIALAAPAPAGPWLRERGTGFLSFSVGAGGGSVTPMLYADWGLTETTTLALSGHVTSDAGALELALIRPLPLPFDGHVASYGLAVKRTGGDVPDYLAGLAMNWGRGLPRGWLAAEGAVYTGPAARLAEVKLDLTWGRTLAPELAGMIQLHASYQGDAIHASLVPSAVLTLRDGLRLNIGATQGLSGPRETGAKVGLWLDF